MCRAVTCRECGKTTWSGCGQHVDHVMAGVPRSQRCPGHATEPAAGGGWLRRLLGRG
jgi:hypothetical protein